MCDLGFFSFKYRLPFSPETPGLELSQEMLGLELPSFFQYFFSPFCEIEKAFLKDLKM